MHVLTTNLGEGYKGPCATCGMCKSMKKNCIKRDDRDIEEYRQQCAHRALMYIFVCVAYLFATVSAFLCLFSLGPRLQTIFISGVYMQFGSRDGNRCAPCQDDVVDPVMLNPKTET